MQTKPCKVSSDGEHNYVAKTTESIVAFSDEVTVQSHTAVYCTRCADVQDLRAGAKLRQRAQELGPQPDANAN